MASGLSAIRARSSTIWPLYPSSRNRQWPLLDREDDRVRFRWRDYRAGGKSKAMTLDAFEFMRRFLSTSSQGLPRASVISAFSPTLVRRKACPIRAALDVPAPRPSPNLSITANAIRSASPANGSMSAPAAAGAWLTFSFGLPPNDRESHQFDATPRRPLADCTLHLDREAPPRAPTLSACPPSARDALVCAAGTAHQSIASHRPHGGGINVSADLRCKNAPNAAPGSRRFPIWRLERP